MLERLSQFVLRQRLLIVIATVVLAGWGFYAWRTLPIDAFPDVTNVQAMILTEAPGLTPSDVEWQITFPIELAMQGLPGVREIRSLSKAELSQVTVVFENYVDTYFARQLVFERLQSAREELPEWAEPEMGPISTGLGEVFQYTLESDERDLTELRTLQDWVVAPRLRTLTGVNEINSFGGLVRQIQVLVDPEALLKYDLTMREVVGAAGPGDPLRGGARCIAWSAWATA